MPLHRRLPKRGFKNVKFAWRLNEVNLGKVQAAIDTGLIDAGAVVDVAVLIKAGLLRRAKDGVRLLGGGELKAKVAFEVHGASKSAAAAVEKLGGSVKRLAPPKPEYAPKAAKESKKAKKASKAKEAKEAAAEKPAGGEAQS